MLQSATCQVPLVRVDSMELYVSPYVVGSNQQSYSITILAVNEHFSKHQSMKCEGEIEKPISRLIVITS